MKTKSEKENNEEGVEKVFQLLRDAKSCECKQNNWLATAKYVEAYQILETLADEEEETRLVCGSHNDDDNTSDKDVKKRQSVAHLYRSKAREYWNYSRHCLIAAMEQEKIHDEQQQQEEFGIENNDEGERTATTTDPSITSINKAYSCVSLDDDQARMRNLNFSLLFSRCDTEKSAAIDEKDGDKSNGNVIEQQMSLEERLQNLNKSLPSGFKSTDERMVEVNKGLNKLGLSLFTQKVSFDGVSKMKSEEEQIDDIMAQAQDEVNVESIMNDKAHCGTNTKEDEDYTDDDSDVDDENDEDSLLDDDQLSMKLIQKNTLKAKLKLEKLFNILDEARTMKAKEDMDTDEEDELLKDDANDDDNDDSSSSFGDGIEKSNSLTLRIRAKQELRKAQRDLGKALAEFKNIIPI